MKTVRVAEAVKLVGMKTCKDGERFIDYYVVMPRRENIYAFTKRYTKKTYSLCKSGVRINELLTVKSRDEGVMRLVKYIKYILSYLIEEYRIPLEI